MPLFRNVGNFNNSRLDLDLEARLYRTTNHSCEPANILLCTKGKFTSWFLCSYTSAIPQKCETSCAQPFHLSYVDKQNGWGFERTSVLREVCFTVHVL